MLYHLLYPLHTTYSVFNVFRYITFRTVYAILTALVISFVLGPWLLRELKKYQIGQTIREDGPQSHLTKAGTPTMGGILVLIAFGGSTLLWADLSNEFIWFTLLSTFGFGVVGFMDDYLKVIKKRSLGLTAKQKLLAQFLIGLVIALSIYFTMDDSLRGKLSVPFFKKVLPDLGFFYILLALFIIVGTSNAVNLTDGLDGLAIGPVIVATTAYMIISYVTGHALFAHYLNIVYVAGAGELSVLCGAIVGASLGFLWFNAYPAQMFMGDVGALALGGALGTIAIISKHELILVIIGGVFVIEAFSVILQVASYKLTGKRIFRMAPLHHHFEEEGWKEPKIIVRFWIISIILALLSLSTLKLR